jgi:hypothetical protein
MAPKQRKPRRRFHAHGASHADALNGLLLATFPQRLLGYLVDVLLAVFVWAPLEFSWRMFILHEKKIEMSWTFHEAGNIIVMILYFGLANYFGNGQTPGKWVARTRAVRSPASGWACGNPLSAAWDTAPQCSKRVWDSYNSSGIPIACAHRTAWPRPS